MYFRRTATKQHIYRIFQRAREPITAQGLLQTLEAKYRTVNKTTIYRELEVLLKNDEIIELDFGEGQKRYELKSNGHHHHLVCRKCKKITHIVLKKLENSLIQTQQYITRKEGFKVTDHALELYGTCGGCQ